MEKSEAVAVLRLGVRLGTDGKLRYTLRTDKPVVLVHDHDSDIPITSRYASTPTVHLRPGDTFDLAVVLPPKDEPPAG